jgi:glycosyltransferase involved in cell wall biosynthesis
LAIAIPAYQAQRWIGDVVRRSLPFADTVLVVDDGSTDATAQAAQEAGAEVFRQAENQGKGAALRRAFDELFRRGFERIVTLDADGQHRPEEIPKLLAAAEGADLVLGTRAHHFGQMGGLRRVSNRLSSRLISKLARTPLEDVQTGFRLYTRHLLDETGFPEDRFQAESAVVIRAGLRGLRIVSVAVELGHADGRASSHYRALVDGLRIAWAVARARLEGRRA